MPDDNELSDKAKEILASMQVIDMRQAYAEQQEQKRLDFEADQEQKRLDFEADQEIRRQDFERKLEAQKAKRDWMMVIVTFAAVAAAYWTGWEARHARIEASEAAKESLKLQTSAMQLDQRPYVNLSSGHWQVRSTTAYITVDINTVGKTAALNIKERDLCASVEKRDRQYPELSDELDSVSVSPIAVPGQHLEFHCATGLTATQSLLRVIIEISYNDLFSKTTHISTVCFTNPKRFVLSGHYETGELVLCPEYPIKIM